MDGKLHYDRETNEVVASGRVHFKYRDLDLFCDEFRWNVDEAQLDARGHVKLTQNARTFTGERLRYRTRDRSGSVDRAHVQIEGFDFTGEEIIVTGATIRIKQAAVTACKASSRHFEIRSEEIEFVRGQQVTLRRSYLVVAGNRLLRIPKYTVNLRRGDSIYSGQGLTPVLFVNGRDGVFLGGRYLYQFDPGRNHFFGAADFGYSVTRGFRGGPEFGYEHKDFLVVLRAKYRETADYHFNPGLLVDVRPELVVTSRPVPVIPRYVGAYASVKYGAFRELPANLTSNRRQYEFHLDTRPQTPRYRYYAHGYLRQSDYSSSNTQLTVYGAEVGIHGKITKALQGDFLIAVQEQSGRSHFSFDEVLISRELAANVDYRVNRDWIIPFLVRYDLRRGSIPDLRLGLMRAYDCVAYGLSFDTARREFRFEGRLLIGSSK